jgi:hypothetical protein
MLNLGFGQNSVFSQKRRFHHKIVSSERALINSNMRLIILNNISQFYFFVKHGNGNSWIFNIF